MYDLTISNARLADAPGLWDICAGNGQVLAVEPAGRIHAARETLRADGRLLLPGLSGEVARHSAGRAAFGGAAGLYRWNADELDEERNGKLRMENGKLA